MDYNDDLSKIVESLINEYAKENELDESQIDDIRIGFMLGFNFMTDHVLELENALLFIQNRIKLMRDSKMRDEISITCKKALRQWRQSRSFVAPKNKDKMN